jgi:hypothetical protein
MKTDLQPIIMREREARLGERFSIAGYLRRHEDLYALLNRQTRSKR